MSGPIAVLALSPQLTSTAGLLGDAARARGVAVRTVDGADPRPGPAEPAAYYGGPLFGARVAAALDVALLVPPDDFLQSLPPELAGRRITLRFVAAPAGRG